MATGCATLVNNTMGPKNFGDGMNAPYYNTEKLEARQQTILYLKNEQHGACSLG